MKTSNRYFMVSTMLHEAKMHLEQIIHDLEEYRLAPSIKTLSLVQEKIINAAVEATIESRKTSE